ncbi:hypothetical protein PENSPDRAFT_757524 [Peniophora sp. CONT]|nr:hypothetical protein PENSPDRAFT_757524 [Peniophora sp. CONT]
MPSDVGHNEHELPMDIVRLLFDHAAVLNPPRCGRGPPSYQPPSLGWITLTHVCREWRNAGLGMPLLWASIATTFLDPSIANELFVRARGCPITVDILPHLLDRDRHDKGPLYSWISEHIFQVRVLKVWNPTLYDTLRHGNSETPLPLLHTIHVDDYDSIRTLFDVDDSIRSLHTLQLCSPGLRSATLTNVILPPYSTSTLRQLDLTFSGRLQAPWSVLHEFLRCCPQLEMLDLRATSPWSREEEDHANDVQLKKLKIARLSVDLEQTAWDIWRPVKLKGISRNSAHYPDTRSPKLCWWAMVKVALKARSNATCGALRRLVLEGKWSNAENWDMKQDGEELRECLSRRLVQEIIDHRTFEKYEVVYNTYQPLSEPEY